jgi:hypothetical protein
MQLQLNRWRMVVHGLEAPRFADLHDAVSFFGAVQAQNVGPATWGLAQRITNASITGIATALAEGRVIRTHVLRPTWHYVAAEDLRSWLALTGPRVLAQAASQMRNLELDGKELERCHRVIAAALEHRTLSRLEIGEELADAGIEIDSMRLTYIVMHAELTGLVCSGSGAKQPSYALLDERLPAQSPPDLEQALRELTVRYFTGHGPATVNDFRWWSSLQVSDIKRALAGAGDGLHQFERDGRTYWTGEPGPFPPRRSPTVNLIEVFDEYLVGYRESRDVADPAGHETTARGVRGLPFGMVLVNGEAAGRWRVGRSGSQVDVELYPYRPLEANETAELERVATRYAAFRGWTLRDVRVRNYP